MGGLQHSGQISRGFHVYIRCPIINWLNNVFNRENHTLCAGCNTRITSGHPLRLKGAVWHPRCICCRACREPIFDDEVSFKEKENEPYHRSCFKQLYHPKCDVCGQFIPEIKPGQIDYKIHSFWSQKYCPSHEHDNTPRCCSCERMEPKKMQYIALDDNRKLCLDCIDSAIIDDDEVESLCVEIRNFYNGLNMRIDEQIPVMLVEEEYLKEITTAVMGNKVRHHITGEIRGLCFSEEHTKNNIIRREVIAILVLYGLPRLLTGSILAHEFMHAWLKINGFGELSCDVEEGICQVIAHMWLEAEVKAGSFSKKEGDGREFDKEVGEFGMYKIAETCLPSYGGGFRAGHAAVVQHSLHKTLDHIRLTGSFP